MLQNIQNFGRGGTPCKRGPVKYWERDGSDSLVLDWSLRCWLDWTGACCCPVEVTGVHRSMCGWMHITSTLYDVTRCSHFTPDETQRTQSRDKEEHVTTRNRLDVLRFVDSCDYTRDESKRPINQSLLQFANMLYRQKSGFSVEVKLRNRGTQWCTEGGGGLAGGSAPPPTNSEGPPKPCQTQPDCENC